MRQTAGWRRTWPSVYAFAFALLSLLPPASAQSPEPIFALIDQRLELMKDVAAYKYIEGLPIEDLKREAIVLQKATTAAEGAGLQADSVTAFFRSNIEAAKSIQRCWHHRWEDSTTSPPQSAPHLGAEIRPQLIEIGNELNEAIARFLDKGGALGVGVEGQFLETVQVDCLAVADKASILTALSQIELKP